MTVPDDVNSLALDLASLATKNLAASVATRVKAIRAGKKQEEQINELVELINELIDDRNQLVNIAQAYEQTFISQQISQEDINYIITTLVPLAEDIIQISDPEGSQEALRIVKAVASVHTLTVLQLVGFNFKQAIGEPLTDVIEGLIRSKIPNTTNNAVNIRGNKSKK